MKLRCTGCAKDHHDLIAVTRAKLKMKSVYLLLFLLCGCVMPQPDIPNLAVVSVHPLILRGGQPTDAGWKYLRGLGVTQDIKLNEESEGSDNAAAIEVLRAPVNLRQQLGFQPMPDLAALAIVDIHDPTFIHCEHGQDRTGLFVALYRIHHGWTAQDAESEMLRLGFHKELRGLWDYWQKQK